MSKGCESLPCTLTAVALRKVGPTPCLGSAMELTAGEGEQERDPAPYLALGELAWAVLESSPCWCGCGKIGRLTNSAMTQAQIQISKLAHPSIYPN